MSSFVDQIYDEMNLQEIICRLPSELAVSALKRRINSADKFNDFFKAAQVEEETSKCEQVVKYLNDIVYKYDIPYILSVVNEEYHPILHGYLNDKNKERFLKDGADKLSIKFLFNLTDNSDLPGMRKVLNRILSEVEPSRSQILTVLNRIPVNHFQSLLEMILKDSRPIVRSCVISVFNKSNYETVSEHQKMIGLKAFAKIPSSNDNQTIHIQKIDFKLFESLKPLERLFALDKYLMNFPIGKGIKVFDPEPSEEDFDAILFAGCFQYYDLVESIKNKYTEINQSKK